jgi:hypothetical protein
VRKVLWQPDEKQYSALRRQHLLDALQQDFFAERAGEHAGNDFFGVWNLQGGKRIGRAVENAHRRRTLTKTADQVRSGHFRRMQLRDKQVDGAGAQFRQFKRLGGIGGRKNEEFGILQNVLDSVQAGLRILHNENYWMMRRSLSLAPSHEGSH